MQLVKLHRSEPWLDKKLKNSSFLLAQAFGSKRRSADTSGNEECRRAQPECNSIGKHIYH